MDPDTKATVKLISFIIFSILGLIVLYNGVQPLYHVWDQRLLGEAELARATYNRQVAVQEAQAKMEAAKSLAQAEIERAKGVAQANKIIGDSLKDNESYLRYLWIDGLNKGEHDVIYVPTEGSLPILEAGKRPFKVSK